MTDNPNQLCDSQAGRFRCQLPAGHELLHDHPDSPTRWTDAIPFSRPRPTVPYAEPWREPFLMAFAGGPLAGDRVIRDGDFGLSWPLPDLIAVPGSDSGGCYRKASESQLPARGPDSHVVRGARYTWILG